MPHSTQDYPDLAEFMSGWFHQDFDIEGTTIPEIVAAFNASSSSAQREALISDISRFLKIRDEGLDETFIATFNPDIDPKGFAPTTRAFLEELIKFLSD